MPGAGRTNTPTVLYYPRTTWVSNLSRQRPSCCRYGALCVIVLTSSGSERAMTHGTIFVANDDHTYIEMVRDLLIDAGYPHVVGHGGGGAFHRIRDEQPTLVILDINLISPGRGWSTLDAVKLHPKTRHIPVILCSTDMHLIEKKAGMLRDLGCDSLEKPFDIETLLEKVAAAIGPPSAE
jgi:CheY-like chemotaxis protein